MKIQLDPLALHKIPDSKRVREEKVPLRVYPHRSETPGHSSR